MIRARLYIDPKAVSQQLADGVDLWRRGLESKLHEPVDVVVERRQMHVAHLVVIDGGAL